MKQKVWNNVYGFNFTPLQSVALAEPLVDTVDLKAVVSDPCMVMSIDLHTVQVSDLAFTAPFSLPIRRNDFAHALIAWFDIDFSECHKPIKFSTGPHAKYTHWKQTVFYLNEQLTVKQGENITGVLSCKPTEKNPRDLDIKIAYELETDEEDRTAKGTCLYKMYSFSSSSLHASTHIQWLVYPLMLILLTHSISGVDMAFIWQLFFEPVLLMMMTTI